MSLTSYRAAPPRDTESESQSGPDEERERVGGAWRRPTLPPLREAVPWALRVFTAEFGMGSGVWPLAMATRPVRCDVRSEVSVEKCLRRVGLGAARGRWWGAAGATRLIKPIERLVPVSCGDCSRSTSGLSTWWSTTALNETWF